MAVDLFHSFLANAWTTLLVVFFFGGSIFVHELGHYLAARRRGVHVERFSIGIGPAIWSRRGQDGVEYRVAWIPIGGYVLLPQLADMSAIEGASATDLSRLPPVGYASKIIIFAAGAAFNVLFAFALACIIWIAGMPESNETDTTRIGYVSRTLDLPDGSAVPSPAAVAGLRAGDIVKAVDFHAVNDWNDLRQSLATSSGRDKNSRPQTVFTVSRDGRTLDITVLPRLAGDDRIRSVGILPAFKLKVAEVAAGTPASKCGFKADDEIVALDGTPMLNNVALWERLEADRGKAIAALVRRNGREISLAIAPRPESKPGTDFGLAFILDTHLAHPSPFAQIWEQVTLTYRTFLSLVNPSSDIGLSKLTGPVGIVHMLSGAAAAGYRVVLMFTILVNVNLAIINLMPIPVLDGGHMLFATIGRLRGRALPSNLIMTVQSVFVVLIATMFLYVTVFDVRRWARDVQSERAAAVEKP